MWQIFHLCALDVCHRPKSVCQCLCCNNTAAHWKSPLIWPGTSDLRGSAINLKRHNSVLIILLLVGVSTLALNGLGVSLVEGSQSKGSCGFASVCCWSWLFGTGTAVGLFGRRSGLGFMPSRCLRSGVWILAVREKRKGFGLDWHRALYCGVLSKQNAAYLNKPL